MIVTKSEPSEAIRIPTLPPGVLDLSANVQPDTWMASPDTNLLKAHRTKTLIAMVAAVVAIGAIAAVVIVFLGRGNEEAEANDPPPVKDAGIAIVDAPKPDAGVSKEDIIAISRYGFLSINASAKTSIYIDGKLIGETPLTRLPLSPGPYKVKAIGPRGKKPKEFDITIYGGRDTEHPLIKW